MWVALLNLENMYGTEENLQKVFERAIQYCEPMPVYQQLADIYAKSSKIKVRTCPFKMVFNLHFKTCWIFFFFVISEAANRSCI